MAMFNSTLLKYSRVSGQILDQIQSQITFVSTVDENNMKIIFEHEQASRFRRKINRKINETHKAQTLFSPREGCYVHRLGAQGPGLKQTVSPETVILHETNVAIHFIQTPPTKYLPVPYCYSSAIQATQVNLHPYFTNQEPTSTHQTHLNTAPIKAQPGVVAAKFCGPIFELGAAKVTCTADSAAACSRRAVEFQLVSTVATPYDII